MPIVSLNDINGGIRKLPPRLMPPNSLKDALNIIPNINGNVFETCGLDSLFSKQEFSTSGNALNVISCDIDGTSILIYFDSYNFAIIHFVTYETIIYIPDSDSSLLYPILLLPSRGTYIFHNAKYNCLEGDVRRIYKNLDNPRFCGAVGGSEGYGHYKLPQLIQSKYTAIPISGYIGIESDFYADLNDMVDVDYFGLSGTIAKSQETSTIANPTWDKSTTPQRITFYEPDSEIYVKVGVRFDGYQSIIGKCIPKKTTIVGSEESGCLRLELNIHEDDFTRFGERVTGFDVYIARPADIIEEDGDSLYWMYVDHIPMDYDEELYELCNTYNLTNGATSINIFLTAASLTPIAFLRPYIYRECILEVLNASGDTLEEIPIANNTEDTIYLRSGESITSATGVYGLRIRTKWHECDYGNGYQVVRFISSLSGEALSYRTGVSDRKIVNVHDYCPPAHFIESFKGRIWLADYYEYGEKRRRNRLILNSINSDGNSCEDIYDVNLYIEFDGSITFLKATDEVLYIGTSIGIYSLKFVPTTNEYQPSWIVNKISDVVITDRKRVWAAKDSLYLYDGNTIYLSDGVFVKNILSEEMIDILNENYTSSNFTGNKYAIAYDSTSDSLYLFIDKIIKFKNGILKFYIDTFDYTFPCLNLFNSKLYFFMGNDLYNINPISTGDNVESFLIELYDNDLGVKEDKYFNEFVIDIYKDKGKIVVVEIYNESGLIKSYTLSSSVLYDNKITIKPSKSVSRRFKTFKYKIYNTSGSPYVKVASIDIDFDVIKKTTIPSSITK